MTEIKIINYGEKRPEVEIKSGKYSVCLPRFLEEEDVDKDEWGRQIDTFIMLQMVKRIKELENECKDYALFINDKGWIYEFNDKPKFEQQ